MRAQTAITTNYNQSITVERLQQVSIQVQVNKTKTAQPIQTGLVDMLIDNVKEEEIKLTTTNTIRYVVPVDFGLGKHTMIITFLGTDSLQPSTISYDYYL